ncbi:hypothetical protein TRFO_05264 [Tritrichomonas foetus]|uniref:Uncharacterized protein n=1 Tax=Tritrichomonas foetus TaxID=1144522 RepID=A0A1J4KBK5_9EUKA|nr:hypothetical protein TRFO_05264 [Tritrichomonas foetus]|eukprot:OHT07070.1 hypothetical protein TRFO_05264 [Tritrichomonas foetus]
MNLPYSKGDEIQIIPAGDEEHIVFEPPSLNSMVVNDRISEGFIYYLLTHGNSRFNKTLDEIAQKAYESQIEFDKKLVNSNKAGEDDNPNAISQLLRIEEKASNEEFMEQLFAKRLLNDVLNQIKDIDEKIKETQKKNSDLKIKINELRQKLR